VLPSLTRLTELCLEGNRLHALPASIGALRSLRELWLHGNQVRARVRVRV
jgi:leucine-rich repeat protein SHOC2